MVKTETKSEEPKTVEAALVVLLNQMVKNGEKVGIFQDSIEIGTPSKNGAKLKVYGDFGNPADFRRRIRNAEKIRAKFAPDTQ
jgi:hypothetical protein